MKLEEAYDVAIIGGAFGGPIAAMMLAARGARVVVLEKSVKAPFRLGESISTETTLLLRAISDQYGLPEIESMSSYPNLKTNHPSVVCFPKRYFQFLFHPSGKELLHEANRSPAPADMHVERASFDTVLLKLAETRGVTVLTGESVVGFESGESGQTIVLEGGARLRARFTIDASGMARVLSKLLNLESEQSSGLVSACVCTHLRDVKPWPLRNEGLPHWPGGPLHGTCHHIFPEGWMWVIPFEDGRVSVGIQTRQDGSCEGLEPFCAETLVERYPATRTVFEGSRNDFPWRTLRTLQYRGKTAVGDGYALLPQAVHFSDPLLSPGMLNTLLAITRLVPLVLDALAAGDVRRSRFVSYESEMMAETRTLDLYTHGLYISFANFELFELYHSVYRLAATLSGMTARIDQLSGRKNQIWYFQNRGVRALVEAGHEILDRADRERRLNDPETRRALEFALRDADQFGFFGSRFGKLQPKHHYRIEPSSILTWYLRNGSKADHSQWHVLSSLVTRYAGNTRERIASAIRR